MTTETINKIREVLGDKWPRYKAGEVEWTLCYGPVGGQIKWEYSCGHVYYDVDERQAQTELTLAMLDYATTPGERGGHVITQVSNLDGSDRAWVVINSEDPVPKNKSLFDLLVEVVTKENK